MYSTFISGRDGASRSASFRPLIWGMTTSVNKRWIVPVCLSTIRRASPGWRAWRTGVPLAHIRPLGERHQKLAGPFDQLLLLEEHGFRKLHRLILHLPGGPALLLRDRVEDQSERREEGKEEKYH